MAERPLVRLPEPTKIEVKGKGFRPEKIAFPSRGEQAERFAPRFERLREVLSDPNLLNELHDDPAAIAPERSLVFEITGNKANFYQALRGVKSFELLGEYEDTMEPDRHFHISGKEKKECHSTSISLYQMKRLCVSCYACGSVIKIMRKWTADSLSGIMYLTT